MVNVSIVIPTFNEERRLKQTIDKLVNILSNSGFSFEIIVSDGGSSDKTLAQVPKINRIRIVKSSCHLPKGESLIRGAMEARGEKILFLDADLPISLKDVTRLIEETGENELVLASRYHPKSVGKCPKIRFFLGRLFNKLVRIILNLKLWDTQCGAKCLPAPLAHKILNEIRNRGYVFDVELVLRSLRCGFVVREIPIEWGHKHGSRIKIPKVAFEMFLGVLRLSKLRYKM